MSIAKKCDICGKFYEPYNLKNCAEKPNGFRFLNIDNSQKFISHSITDCCPSCMSRLQAYIEYIKEIKMTDLNKMFSKFTEMDFKKRDVVILPIESIVDNLENACPNELLWVDGRCLKELEELCDCTADNRGEDLSCYECWRRASKIVMKYYFGEEEDGNEKN